MFFTLSKLTWYVMAPSHLMAVLFLAAALCLALRWKRAGAVLGGLAITVLLLAGVAPLSIYAMRLQSLGGPVSIYAAVNGQLASKNLDISEKMELGGMNAVRAYPEGEAFGDEGFVATVEARWDLPKFSGAIPGQMQLVAFVDAGSVTQNKRPWTSDDNHRTLSGAGVGAVWSEPGNFMVRAYYAHKLGSGAALSAPDRSGRFWIQAVKYF